MTSDSRAMRRCAAIRDTRRLRRAGHAAASILAAATSCAALSACGEAPAPQATAVSGVNALETENLKEGAGAAIERGQQAVVQYTGWLYDASAPQKKGKQFDSSSSTGQPFRFVIGGGQVIKGWDQGVAGMKVGGSRRLIIPAELAYGDNGAAGVIPPGATLVFDVSLVGIE